MAKRRRLGELLVDACVITEDQLNEALRLQENKHELLGKILVEIGWVSEEEVCRAVADLLHVKYVDVDSALVSQDIVQLAPESLAAKRNILPLFIQDHTLFLAMENPLDVDVIQRIEFRTGMQVKPLIAPPRQLRETVRKHYNVDEYIGQMLGNVRDTDMVRVENDEDELPKDTVDISEVRKISEGSQVVKLANLVISDGIKKRASDIHIEPSTKGTNVRYRIDGLLSRGIRIPKWLQLPLISRIKVIAGMDIAEHRKPQDGRISVRYAHRKIDLRVSTLLTNFGEKVVIRILDQKASAHSLEGLGMLPAHLQRYRNTLRQPQGWVLVTGPTGSGKTTTLYASLTTLKDVTKNIVTVEDPIEYQLEGINQVQVNPKAGLTFASGLRSILRQDPNIILVGEIRDQETAEIAMQAAETGHLVLSTLHTNDAVSTVNRLFNLGIAPDLVASNLLIVIAQRLVRKICPHCKTEYTPQPEELRQIGLYNGNALDAAYYKGVGCDACHGSGYAGQIGVYELFLQSDRLREAIAKRPTKQVLKQLARETGMRTMLEDGIEKIHKGITTIAEVARVCPLEPDEIQKQVSPEKGRPQKIEVDASSEERAAECLRQCTQCGAALENLWRVCPFCGTPIVSGAREPVPVASVPVPSASEGEASEIRILTADDEAPVREMIRLLLEKEGYKVIETTNGEDALRKIRAELPDLVLLDVDMPQKDGFSVCKAIRSSVDTMFIPVLMLTGKDSLEEKLEGLAAGADDYMTKPFKSVELLARISAVLQHASQRRSAGQEAFPCA